MNMDDTGPINPKFPRLWLGGDYNPDQWPEAVRLEDLRLMKLAKANVMNTAIFSWSQLEPRPGEFEWGWLDETFDRLYEAGARVALATPSAAHPRWLTAAHPEVMAVERDGIRRRHSHRQCFCPTSPVYREHVARIDRALAERYRDHPALVLWHVSNEYGPRCWCDLCVEAFREWLKARYGDLDTMNLQYWTAFWSQRFTDWSQVEPAFENGGIPIQGVELDWKRFMSRQVCDFFAKEVDVLHEVTPEVPVTTNLMGTYEGLDYSKFADVMDVISWDSYPDVGGDPSSPAFCHALMRGLKANRPWLLIEQTPSSTNWKPHPTLKPPGVMGLWSWQAIGHGSDSVMYFQWRRSRGAHEKFHGAVVAHVGDETPRVFQEVRKLGDELDRASGKVIGTRVKRARVGVIWDQENRWAVEGSVGPSHDKDYVGLVQRHYAAFWRRNVPVDVIRMDADWTQYGIIAAPMPYMVRSGEFDCENDAKKIEEWVASGGTFVTTFLAGIVNENDLVYEGGYPGPLRKLLGIWVEETDGVEPGKKPNTMVMERGVLESMSGPYACDRLLDLLETEGADILARYGANWYAGRPCLTRNTFGEGKAYYIAADADDEFLGDFYAAVAREEGIEPIVPSLGDKSRDVEVLMREGSGRELLFVLNHSGEKREIDLGKMRGRDVLGAGALSGTVRVEAYGVRVLEIE
jgi:beta-galactosidase